MKFDDKFSNVGYYHRQIIPLLEDNKQYIIKFQDSSLNCFICGTPTEWICKSIKSPICSDECLEKIVLKS